MSRAQPEKWQDLIAWFSPRLTPWCVSQIIIPVGFALSPFRNFPFLLQVAAIFLNGLQRSPLYGLEIHTSVRPLFTVLLSVDLLVCQLSLKQWLRWCIVQIDGIRRVSVIYEHAGKEIKKFPPNTCRNVTMSSLCSFNGITCWPHFRGCVAYFNCLTFLVDLLVC